MHLKKCSCCLQAALLLLCNERTEVLSMTQPVPMGFTTLHYQVDLLSSVGFKLLVCSVTLSKHIFIFPLVLMYDMRNSHYSLQLAGNLTMGNKIGIPFSLTDYIYYIIYIYI